MECFLLNKGIPDSQWYLFKSLTDQFRPFWAWKVFIFDNLLLCFCLVEIRKSLLREPTIEQFNDERWGSGHIHDKTGGSGHIHDKTGGSGHIHDKTGGSGQLGNGNFRPSDLS